MADEQRVPFKGHVHRDEDSLKIHLDDDGVIEVEDDVQGHADLEGRELQGRSDDGQAVRVVIDRAEGDDVEGHRFSGYSDRNLKEDVIPITW